MSMLLPIKAVPPNLTLSVLAPSAP